MQLQSKKPLSYQGSLYHKIQVLMHKNELQALFHALEYPLILPVSGIEKEKKCVKTEDFFKAYQQYLEDGLLKSSLCVALSHPEAKILWQEAGSGFIARPQESVIHCKPFSFVIDTKGNFRAGMRGPSAKAWGLEFKYPMLFMDPLTGNIEKTLKMPYVNNALFAILRKWIRKGTKPASFMIGDKEKISSYRIGKCFAKIH